MLMIQRIRDTVDAKLGKLEARADAFEAALHRTKERVDERIQGGKQDVHRALDTLQTQLDTVQQIAAGIEQLKVQTALGKAEASEALAAARQRLHDIARTVEAEVDASLAEVKALPAEALQATLAAYVRAVDRLDAEFEAAEARFTAATAQAGAGFEQRRQEVSHTLAAFKEKLAQKKDHAAAKLVSFEEEVRGGFAQVAKAFKDLFS